MAFQNEQQIKEALDKINEVLPGIGFFIMLVEPTGQKGQDVTAFCFSNSDIPVDKSPEGFVMQCVDSALMHALDAADFSSAPGTIEWHTKGAELAECAADRFRLLAATKGAGHEGN